MIRKSILTLALAAFGASAGPAAEPGEMPAPMAEDLISSTETCIDIFMRNGEPDVLLPDSDWEKSERTPRYPGSTGPTIDARSRAFKLLLSYDPNRRCTVIGEMKTLSFDGAPDVPRSIGTVVNGVYDRIGERFPVLGFRAGELENPIIMTDGFEVEFTMLDGARSEGTAYIINVDLPEKPAEGEDS